MNPKEQKKQKKSLTTGEIIGIVLGSIAIFFLVIIAFILYKNRSGVINYETGSFDINKVMDVILMEARMNHASLINNKNIKKERDKITTKINYLNEQLKKQGAVKKKDRINELIKHLENKRKLLQERQKITENSEYKTYGTNSDEIHSSSLSTKLKTNLSNSLEDLNFYQKPNESQIQIKKQQQQHNIYKKYKRWIKQFGEIENFSPFFIKNLLTSTELSENTFNYNIFIEKMSENNNQKINKLCYLLKKIDYTCYTMFHECFPNKNDSYFLIETCENEQNTIEKLHCIISIYDSCRDFYLRKLLNQDINLNENEKEKQSLFKFINYILFNKNIVQNYDDVTNKIDFKLKGDNETKSIFELIHKVKDEANETKTIILHKQYLLFDDPESFNSNISNDLSSRKEDLQNIMKTRSLNHDEIKLYQKINKQIKR